MNGYLSEKELSSLRDELLTSGECLADPELHSGPQGAESPQERAARVDVAREVCQSCPVAAKCLTYALRTRPARGVWAGFTAGQIGALADLLSTPPANGRLVFRVEEAAELFTASEGLGTALRAYAADVLTVQLPVPDATTGGTTAAA